MIPFTTGHSSAGLGAFAAQSIPNGKNIRPYYGSLIYNDLPKQLLSMNERDKGTITVFDKYI